MLTIFASVLLVMGLAVVCAPAVCAKEKIVWPYVCFKPVYICEDNQLVAGSGFHILNLMWKKIPEYEHALVQMPIKRILESAKQGEQQLFYGLYKTPEREKYLEFSLPCRISIPTYLVVRKKDLQTFSGSQKVSLKQILEDQQFTFLYLKSVSFGKGIDEILEMHKDKPNVLTEYDTTHLIGKSLKLLLNNRVDAMLSVDGTRYDANEMGVADEIAYISLAEQNRYDIGHIAAPKNAWGRAMIAKVDEILREVVPTDAFFQYFSPLVDKDMQPELKRQFNKLIIAPSKVKH